MTTPTKKVPGRPFKPGQSGNPNGRPKLPEELRKVKGLTSEEVRMRFALYATKSLAELRLLAQDDTLTGLEHNIVQALLNPDKFPFFLDRMAGKVPDVNHSVNVNVEADPDYEEVPKEALLKLVGEKPGSDVE